MTRRLLVVLSRAPARFLFERSLLAFRGIAFGLAGALGQDLVRAIKMSTKGIEKRFFMTFPPAAPAAAPQVVKKGVTPLQIDVRVRYSG